MLRPKKKLTRKEIKQDKLVTYYFKVTQFIQRHLNYALGGLIVIALIVPISLLISHSKRNAEKSASREFMSAMAEYQRANNTEAADIFRTMIKAYGGTRSARLGYYYLANAYYQTGDADQAIEFYKKFVKKYGNDELLGSAAMMGIGNCLVQKGQFKEAANQFMQVVKKHPRSIQAPESLLNAGLAFMKAQEKPKAIAAFEKLVKDYPDSRVKADAELQLAKLRSSLS